MRFHVYYHMDADGHASAGILQDYLQRTHGKDVDIRFQPINYGMEPYTRDIGRGDAVYMLDFALQPAQKMWDFMELCDERETKMPIWIDHHKTSIEAESEVPELKRVFGIRQEGKAACELVWEFFNEGRPMNPIINLVGRWDTWRRDAGDWDTLVVPLQTYLRFVRSDPKHNREFWPRLLNGDVQEFLIKVAAEGGMLTKYHQQNEDSRMRGFARVGKFAGHKAIIVNSPQMSSSPFERMKEVADVDVMVAWVFNKQGQFAVSIYTQKKEIDLSVLCKRLGQEGPYKSGGGHPGAAGFQTDWEHLSRLMEF